MGRKVVDVGGGGGGAPSTHWSCKRVECDNCEKEGGGGGGRVQRSTFSSLAVNNLRIQRLAAHPRLE